MQQVWFLSQLFRGCGVPSLQQTLATQGSAGCSNLGWCQFMRVEVNWGREQRLQKCSLMVKAH